MVSKVAASRHGSQSDSLISSGKAWWLIGLIAPVLLATMACGGADAGSGRQGADLILVNGSIRTMDPAAPMASAVAIRNQHIVAVGDRAAIRPWIVRSTRVIDLKGKTVTPGLTDSHAHLLGLGASVENVSLKGAVSEAEAANVAAAAAAKLPPGEWLIGRGWDQNLWAGQEFPRASTLDKLIGDRPASLRRIDGHALWASTAALTLAGIDRDTPDPRGGTIVRAANGQPTGVLIDMAMDLVEDKIPPATDEVRERRILLAARMAIEAGLTCVHEMGIDQRTADIYRNLADEGRLPLRIYAFLAGDPAVAEQLTRKVAETDRDGLQMFILRGVKLFADGALGSRGARLLAPYTDTPDSEGLWITQPGELARAVEAATSGGWQVAIHAIGDAGVRSVLDAYEAVGNQHPGQDLRLRVEHAQVVAPDDMQRFAKLGVIASMQPTHATSDMPWAEARLGPERIRGSYAWRTLLESGAHVAFGSDFPVEDVAPLGGIYAGISRQDRQGQPPGGWYPDETLTLDQAVAAFTSAGAFASFVEDFRGRIQRGMVADLTVFDRDLAAAGAVTEAQISMTIVGGVVVFESAP